jgi:hypothetical protein
LPQLLRATARLRTKTPPLSLIIKNEERHKYYDALDVGALTGDYTDFVKMVTKQAEEMIDLYLKIIK